MTPAQREAALRLANVPICDRSISWQSDATILLRELAAEPAQEPVVWMYEHDGMVHDAANPPIFAVNRWTTPVGEPYTETPLYTAPPPAAWQPIETVPHETEVLVWFGPATGVKSATYTDKDGDGVLFWCVTDGKFDPHPVRRYCAPYPTHWMPLPPPPEPT